MIGPRTLPRAALALAALAAGIASAQTPVNRNLEEAERRAERGRYEAALAELARADELPGDPPAARRDAAGLRGICLVMLDRATEAGGSFDAALRLDPAWRPPTWAPARAREAFAAHLAHAVILVHAPLTRVEAGRPVEVSTRLLDPDHRVSDVFAAYRDDPASPWVEASLHPAPGGTLRAFLRVPDPGDDPRGVLVDYYLVAVDASGAVLERSGSDFRPHTFVVVPGGAIAAVELPEPEAAAPREAPPPWYRTWWPWAALGVLAVAAGAGAVVLSRPEPPPDGSLGTVTLPLSGGRP